MTRLSFFLLLALLGSSLYLVNVQYQSRQLFTALDKARSQARSFDVDNERLQVEKRAQAAPMRIEKLAREQLQMRTVTPAITHYANDSVPTTSTARTSPTQQRSSASAGAIQ